MISSNLIMLIGSVALLLFGITFLFNLLSERDLERATEQTATSVFGIAAGAGVVALTLAAEALSTAAAAPDVLVAIAGYFAVSGYIENVSPEVWVGVFLALIVVSRAVRRSSA